MQNPKKIITLLDDFKKIGSTEQNGVTRRVYDQNWILAQKKYAEIAQHYGLYPFLDCMGNIYASTSTNEMSEDIILTGSHMDTVVNGGRLDGTYGTLSSLVALGELYQELGNPKVPLVAVSFSEEEGSRFNATFTGSRYLTKQFDEDNLKLVDHNNVSFESAREQAVAELKKTIPMKPEWKIGKYIELHIEQGPLLNELSKNIGIVTGIVGQKRAQIKIIGQANHAGTTPMNMRHDALRKAIDLINNIHTVLDEVPNLRYTIGQFDVLPNVSNVIPSEVEFSLDIRNLDQSSLDECFIAVEKIVQHYQGSIELTTNVQATKMSDELQQVLINATDQQGLTYASMPSGAGHDAQVISYKFPTCMLFVPSINSISHSPLENTYDTDLLNGYNVLNSALKQLAY